ncbi:MAG: hypothetical protein GC205_01705 [Bacteroidetes bacterium]|nr:hypothetical protein [Bacteroidota bacterium]
MIKFFRRIRQGLLYQGRTGKYLTYAVGEIILVVIGILIALQINNWNEKRKQGKQELAYLGRLLIENEQDLVTFQQSIQDLTKGNKTIEEMATVLNHKNYSDSVVLEKVEKYLIYGCHYPFFNPSTSTFDDLSSTGNMGVINDVDLRDVIVKHYANYDYIKANFQVNADWALPIDAPFYVDFSVLKFEPSTSFIFKTDSENLSAFEVKENREEYLRNAAVHYWINLDCINLLSNVINETTVLVARLSSEIQNHKSN